MKTLTLITDVGELNHHYEVENVGTGDFNGFFTLVLKNENIDEFLSGFINGKTGYKIQIDTDRFCLVLKNKWYSVNKSQSEGLTAFEIREENLGIS